MLTENKKIPKKVMAWLLLVGVILGMTITAILFTVLPYQSAMGLWIILTVIYTIAMAYIDFKYRDLLEKWGIAPKRKKIE